MTVHFQNHLITSMSTTMKFEQFLNESSIKELKNKNLFFYDYKTSDVWGNRDFE